MSTFNKKNILFFIYLYRVFFFFLYILKYASNILYCQSNNNKNFNHILLINFNIQKSKQTKIYK